MGSTATISLLPKTLLDKVGSNIIKKAEERKEYVERLL